MGLICYSDVYCTVLVADCVIFVLERPAETHSLCRPAGRLRLRAESGTQQSVRADRTDDQRVELLLLLRQLLLSSNEFGGRVPDAHSGIVAAAHLAADWAPTRAATARAGRSVGASPCACASGERRGGRSDRISRVRRREHQVVLQWRRRVGGEQLLQRLRALVRCGTQSGTAATAPGASIA